MANVVPFPLRDPEPLERDIAEVVAAISLVARGAARLVRLVNLRRPMAVAADAAAQAGQAGIEFHVERSTGRAELVVGPRR
jgi:hypothetical protein